MEGLLPVLLVAAGAFAAGVAVGTLVRSRRRDVRHGPPPAAAFGPLGPGGAVLPRDVAIEVVRCVRARSPVAAVKLVRDASGLELAEAKAIVDEVRRHDAAVR